MIQALKLERPDFSRFIDKVLSQGVRWGSDRSRASNPNPLCSRAFASSGGTHVATAVRHQNQPPQRRPRGRVLMATPEPALADVANCFDYDQPQPSFREIASNWLDGGK